MAGGKGLGWRRHASMPSAAIHVHTALRPDEVACSAPSAEKSPSSVSASNALDSGQETLRGETEWGNIMSGRALALYSERMCEPVQRRATAFATSGSSVAPQFW